MFKMFKSRFSQLFAFLALIVLMLSYQNFRELSPQFEDIRKFAPDKPEGYDQTGFRPSGQESSPEEVGQRWISSYTDPVARRYEGILMGGLNQLWNKNVTRQPNQVLPGPGVPSDSQAQEPMDPQKSPWHWRFQNINTVKFGYGPNLSVQCAYQNNNVKMSVARPISNDTDLTLNHESLNSQSSVGVAIKW